MILDISQSSDHWTIIYIIQSSSQNRYLGNPDLLAAIIFEIVQHLISPFILISDILKCPYHPIIPYCCYHPIIQYYPPKGNPDLGAALIKLSSFVAIARPLQPFPSQTVIINVIVIIAIIIIIVNDYHCRPHQQNLKQYLDCNCLSPSTFSLQRQAKYLDYLDHNCLSPLIVPSPQTNHNFHN